METRERTIEESSSGALKGRLSGPEYAGVSPGRGEPRQGGQDWISIFDTITDMITIHDRDFNIIGSNKAAQRILGLPCAARKEAKCFRFYHGGDSPPAGCPSCQCLKTGEPATFEIYEPHLKMYLEIRAIPRFDEGGLAGLIHIARDITARKRVEEELEIHRNHLEWLVRERTAELNRLNEDLLREVTERKRAEEDKETLIAELREALASIKTLHGLLPICAWCKKIRDDGGYWKKVEDYLKEHSDASFTHGICPECAGRLGAESESADSGE